MSSTFNLSTPNRKIHVGVILTGGVTELLDVAPVDLMSNISKLTFEGNAIPDFVCPKEDQAKATEIEFHWVNETGEPARLTAGLTILPTDKFSTCPPLDIAVMGAHGFKYRTNEAELAFIRKTYNDCSAFIAICGGSQAAMEAGLLNGKNATCPAPAFEWIQSMAPETKFELRRWQRDGKLWTSGTLLNGLDLMRAFAEQTYGDNSLMMRMLEVGAWPIRDVYFGDVKAEA